MIGGRRGRGGTSGRPPCWVGGRRPSRPIQGGGGRKGTPGATRGRGCVPDVWLADIGATKNGDGERADGGFCGTKGPRERKGAGHRSRSAVLLCSRQGRVMPRPAGERLRGGFAHAAPRDGGGRLGRHRGRRRWRSAPISAAPDQERGGDSRHDQEGNASLRSRPPWPAALCKRPGPFIRGAHGAVQ